MNKKILYFIRFIPLHYINIMFCQIILTNKKLSDVKVIEYDSNL